MHYQSRKSKGLSSESNDFWRGYRDIAFKKGVPQNAINWYVNWATQFKRSLQGKPFSQCAAEEVSNFLDRLRERRNLKPWQVEQARNALGLLYGDFLQVSWARSESNLF